MSHCKLSYVKMYGEKMIGNADLHIFPLLNSCVHLLIEIQTFFYPLNFP